MSASTLKKSLTSLKAQFRGTSKTWPYNPKRQGRTFYEALPIIEERIFQHDDTPQSMEAALKRGNVELDSLQSLLDNKFEEKYKLSFDYSPSYLRNFKHDPTAELEILSNEVQTKKLPGMWAQQIPRLKRWLYIKLGYDKEDDVQNELNSKQVNNSKTHEVNSNNTHEANSKIHEVNSDKTN